MSLEKRIAAIARTIFLPEFSFAANKFQVDKVGQLSSRIISCGLMIC